MNKQIIRARHWICGVCSPVARGTWSVERSIASHREDVMDYHDFYAAQTDGPTANNTRQQEAAASSRA